MAVIEELFFSTEMFAKTLAHSIFLMLLGKLCESLPDNADLTVIHFDCEPEKDIIPGIGHVLSQEQIDFSRLEQRRSLDVQQRTYVCVAVLKPDGEEDTYTILVTFPVIRTQLEITCDRKSIISNAFHIVSKTKFKLDVTKEEMQLATEYNNLIQPILEAYVNRGVVGEIDEQGSWSLDIDIPDPNA